MPIIGNLNAANGSDIGIVEITDNSGADVNALDVQVGGVSAFHVRTKDPSIADKPIIKLRSRVVMENVDGTTAASISDGKSLVFGTVNAVPVLSVAAGGGLQIGDAAVNTKLGFFGSAPVVQPTPVADAAGGAVIDIEGRAALNALLSRLRDLGLVDT